MTHIKIEGDSDLTNLNYGDLSTFSYPNQTKHETTKQNLESFIPDDNETNHVPVMCLICSQSSTQLASCIPRFCGSENCLDPQLWSIYVLTRVLNYPKEECAQLLTFGGLNPSQWFILCEPCFQIVEQVYNLEQEVTKLQAKVEKIKSDVTNRLKDDWSVSSKSDKDKYVVDVRKYIRRYFRHNDGGYKSLEDNRSDENIIEDSDEPPFLPSDESTGNTKLSVFTKKKRMYFTGKNDAVKRKKYKKRDPTAVKPFRVPTPPPSTKVLNTDDDNDKVRKRYYYKYGCPICKRNLSTKSSLANHLKLHKKYRKFTCSECKHPCRNQRELELHLESGHSTEVKTPTYSATLAKSVDTTEPGVYRCKFCSKSLPTESKALYHVSRAHKPQLNMELFPCHICPALSTTLGNLKTHIQQVHDKIYNCARCKLTFNSSSLFDQHRLEKHPRGGGPSICDQCGLEFSRRYRMMEHRKRFHPELSNEKTADHTSTGGDGSEEGVMSKFEKKCQYCETVCCNTAALKVHCKSVHLELYKFKCEFCDAIYLSSQNLKMHVKNVHEKDEKICDLCGAKMKGSSMSYHKRLYCKYRSIF